MEAPSSIATLRRALSATPAQADRELELELGGDRAGRWLSARWCQLPGFDAVWDSTPGAWLLTLRECTGARAERLARHTELQRLSQAVSTRAIDIYEHDHLSNEALELMRARARQVDLVLTDIVMPDLRDQQLAERLAAAGSRAPVLYMSGYTGDSSPEQDVLRGSVGFLAKPFTAEQLCTR